MRIRPSCACSLAVIACLHSAQFLGRDNLRGSMHPLSKRRFQFEPEIGCHIRWQTILLQLQGFSQTKRPKNLVDIPKNKRTFSPLSNYMIT